MQKPGEDISNSIMEDDIGIHLLSTLKKPIRKAEQLFQVSTT